MNFFTAQDQARRMSRKLVFAYLFATAIIVLGVTDDGAPPLGDGESVSIEVNNVNVVPMLASIGDQNANENVYKKANRTLEK